MVYRPHSCEPMSTDPKLTICRGVALVSLKLPTNQQQLRSPLFHRPLLHRQQLSVDCKRLSTGWPSTSTAFWDSGEHGSVSLGCCTFRGVTLSTPIGWVGSEGHPKGSGGGLILRIRVYWCCAKTMHDCDENMVSAQGPDVWRRSKRGAEQRLVEVNGDQPNNPTPSGDEMTC